MSSARVEWYARFLPQPNTAGRSETEMHAYARRFGVITCGEIMSKDVVTLEFGTELGEAWRLMRRHQVHALPVLNRTRRVIGIVSQSDFLKHKDLDEYKSLGARLRRSLRRTVASRANRLTGRPRPRSTSCIFFRCRKGSRRCARPWARRA